ncbi:hypothetical protein Nepgr_009801 [Nepenthes gracilis]|uniref:Uncharacterized protein n=1 Tax=Nepenthes gracilis TaxID=150966 RepID=A0AAD3SBU2_NEPGR|nr:hypothetical protein Nepgr_009801 [Nepenthes gracilis]
MTLWLEAVGWACCGMTPPCYVIWSSTYPRPLIARSGYGSHPLKIFCVSCLEAFASAGTVFFPARSAGCSSSFQVVCTEDIFFFWVGICGGQELIFVG